MAGRILAAMMVASLAAASGLHGATVETVDARQVEGELVSMDAESLVLRVDGQERTLPLDEVIDVRLRPGRDLMTRPDMTVLRTRDEELVALSSLSVTGGKIRARNALLGEATIDISDAAVIYQGLHGAFPQQLEKRCEEYGSGEARLDVLFVAQSQQKWLQVDGFLQEVDDKEVTFRFAGSERSIDRARVPVIRFAKVRRKTPDARGVLSLTDGTRLRFSELSVDGETANVDGALWGKQRIPVELLASVRLINDDVVDLTTLKPVKVVQRGFFDANYPHRVNESIVGKPLRIDRRTYKTGLAMHSFCELTWKLEGQYKQFVALAGIDDAVRPKGKVELAVLVDGKVLQRYDIAGDEPPTAVSVEIEGAETFTLRVGFGSDGLDHCDHLDVVNARLIK